MMKRHSAKNYFLLLLAVLTSVASCKKKPSAEPEPEVQFPLSVSAREFVSKHPVRLFTRDGEVTEEAVIAQFIDGTDGFNDGFEIEPTDIITFHTDSTAEFESLIEHINVRVEAAGKLVFRYPFAPDFRDSYDPLLQPLLDHQRIAKTNTTQLIPAATGMRYIGEVVIVASGTYREFELPATVYLLSRWRGQGDAAASHYQHSAVFSPFNDEFLETLGVRDTVAYQESVTRFATPTGN